MREGEKEGEEMKGREGGSKEFSPFNFVNFGGHCREIWRRGRRIPGRGEKKLGKFAEIGIKKSRG
jgi:hypothetical protein